MKKCIYIAHANQNTALSPSTGWRHAFAELKCGSVTPRCSHTAYGRSSPDLNRSCSSGSSSQSNYVQTNTKVQVLVNQITKIWRQRQLANLVCLHLVVELVFCALFLALYWRLAWHSNLKAGMKYRRQASATPTSSGNATHTRKSSFDLGGVMYFTECHSSLQLILQMCRT